MCGVDNSVAGVDARGVPYLPGHPVIGVPVSKDPLPQLDLRQPRRQRGAEACDARRHACDDIPVPTAGWFTVLVLAVGVERLSELRVARRNASWALSAGGVETGQRHYPWMVLLHAGLLAGCLAEVWLLDRPFLPWLGWPMFLLVLVAQALRWWCISTLGRQWNTRVIVVPDMPLVDRGPYRYLAHPNYVAVVVEGVALPLVHSAWITATAFAILNTWLLTVRIRCESAALREAART